MDSQYEEQFQVVPNACGALGTNTTQSFKYIESGKFMPFERFGELNEKIDVMITKFEEGWHIYEEAIKQTNNKWEASKAPHEVSSGSMTQAFAKLCQDNILICLNVELPPTKDEKTMYQNQERLWVLIARFDRYLSNNIVDIFTSRTELGSISETTAYVRFPFYLGDHVQALCWHRNQVHLGTRKVQAIICVEGKTKYFGPDPVLPQWEATIYGHKLP